jgi:tetratricopeptide (TPR) repeat protein
MGRLNKLNYAITALSLASFLTLPGAIGAAQTTTEPPPPVRQPPPPKPTPTPLPVPTEPATRENRAQAYAKLLEGQRYLWQARAVRDEEKFNQFVQQSRLAFQEAVKFDPMFAEGHTALARLAFEYPPQDLALAEREATLAAKLNPNNYGAHRILGRYYTLLSGLRNGRIVRPTAEKAIVSLREVTRLAPSDSEGWALLGELLLASGQSEEAAKAFTRWSALPANSDSRFYSFVASERTLTPDTAYSRLADALLVAKRGPEALAAVRRAMSLTEDGDEYAGQLVRILEASGDDKEALAEMEKIVAASPDKVELIRLLARMKARAGQIDEAAALLRQALKKTPPTNRDHQALQLNLAQLYANANRNQEAAAVYQEMLTERGIENELLQEEDQREFAANLLDRILDLQKSGGQIKEAEATIARMRRLLGPTDPTADEKQVELLRDTGRREEALVAVRAARARYPQEETFIRSEAMILTDLGRVDEGAKLLRERLTGQPNDFGEYVYLSIIYAQARRGAEAVEAGQKALSLIPADSPQARSLRRTALLVLATAQERAGDRSGSEASLRRVLALEPDNTTALNNLGYFLLDQNERLAEGLELIQRAVKAEPTNASFLDSLGWAYFKLDKLAEAERHLTEAARRNPASATIQEHLGDVYHRQGKTEEARAAWQKALKLTAEPEAPARLKGKLSGKSK